jgi:hypothetical protein
LNTADNGSEKSSEKAFAKETFLTFQGNAAAPSCRREVNEPQHEPEQGTLRHIVVFEWGFGDTQRLHTNFADIFTGRYGP